MILTETVREETLVRGSVKCCGWYREGTSGVPMVLDEMLKWVSLAEARKRNGVSLFLAFR